MTTGYIGEEAKQTEKAGRRTLLNNGCSWPVGQRAWLAATLGIEVLDCLLTSICAS
jgi:hypothetical protein